jgi:nucleotide-binding universal stress UspA family protein
MFEKILVPLDFTDKNRAAVERARDLVRAEGEVTLLHVIEELADIPFEELEDFYRRLEERAVRRLKELAEIAGPARDGEGVEIRREVVYGRRAREIVRFAEERETDLIVLGSHPVDRERPGEAWATLSYQVAILARCPVLLLK